MFKWIPTRSGPDDNTQGEDMKTALTTLAALSGIATASPVLSSNDAQSLELGMDTQGTVAIATMTLDLSGISSWDLFGDSDNVVMLLEGGAEAANSHVIGLGWDVTIDTEGLSWLSDPQISVENSDASAGAFVGPGTGMDTDGTLAFSSGGIVNIVETGFDFFLNADGQFRVEFFEVFDDLEDGVDATFLAGSEFKIQYTIVPAPGAFALMGLGGIVATRRKR